MVVIHSESDQTLMGTTQSPSTTTEKTSSTKPQHQQLASEEKKEENDQDLVPTFLYLPNTATTSTAIENNKNDNCLFLPRTGPVDPYLAQVPALQASRAALLESFFEQQQQPNTLDINHKNDDESKVVLYLTQREVGHAVPSQVDVILSDRATTCHVLIVRSSSEDAVGEPLVTCAHVDGPWYEECLEHVWQRHVRHHHYQSSSCSSYATPQIQMDISLVGGFLDTKGRSQDLSSWLLRTLADLARDYSSQMRCTLQTCVVSSLNHTTTTTPTTTSGSQALYSPQSAQRQSVVAPLLRGLACELATGRIFVAKQCPPRLMGPDILLRQARLWSASLPQQLITAHVSHPQEQEKTRRNLFFAIPAFEMNSYTNLSRLLRMDARELLINSSTSPECEEEDYCDTVRQALVLMQRYTTRQVFGRDWQPRRFVLQRSTKASDCVEKNTKNQWHLVKQQHQHHSPKNTQQEQEQHSHGTKHLQRQPIRSGESKKLRGPKM